MTTDRVVASIASPPRWGTAILDDPTSTLATCLLSGVDALSCVFAAWVGCGVCRHGVAGLIRCAYKVEVACPTTNGLDIIELAASCKPLEAAADRDHTTRRSKLH